MIFDPSFVVALCMIGFLSCLLVTALIREHHARRDNRILRTQNLRLEIAPYHVDPFDPSDLLGAEEAAA